MKNISAVKRFLCCVLCAAFVLGALAAAGCVTDYKRRDIVKYVKEQYGISGFKVGFNRQPLYGADGYIDYLWTVTESDGTVFYVVDDRYYGTEWASNSLTDNRWAIVLKRYIEPNGLPGFEVVPNENPEGWPDMMSFSLRGDYRTRAELGQRVDAINELSRTVPKGVRIPFLLRFDHKFRTIGDYENSAADYSELLYSPGQIVLEDAERRYLNTILDMRYDEYIADYTEDEIHDFVNENAHSFAVVRSDGTCDFFDDLLMDYYGYGISFPTMYEVLRREGYPVEGDKNDYTFTGIDGSVYEFSDYFSDGDWYYYLKDGERVDMEYYFYNHIYYTSIEDYTGIRLADYTDFKKHGQEYIEQAAANNMKDASASDVAAATASESAPENKTTSAAENVSEENGSEETGPVPRLVIEAGGRTFYADIADNSSAEAFVESMRSGPLTLELEDYGNFEKVGPLGFDLPVNDEIITTVPGDIILYQGNKITIYYDENTWKFTRLANIPGATREQLLEALGEDGVTVTMRIEWSE